MGEKKRFAEKCRTQCRSGFTEKIIITEANNLGVKYITVYAFSTENWKRPKEEVDYLMSLLLDYLRNAEKTLSGENVVIRVIGSRKGLSEEICRQIIKTENFTKNNTGIVMNIALNYGGREEIVNAVKNICKDVTGGRQNVDDIDDEVFSSYLYTANQPDVDLLIRTSGEQRLSNFMLWQVSYAEMWFTDKLWPDFKPADLHKAIIDFSKQRQKIWGCVKMVKRIITSVVALAVFVGILFFTADMLYSCTCGGYIIYAI